MMETIRHGDIVIAIIIRADYKGDGIQFFTPDDYSQQLAFMSHPVGKVIVPHVHNHMPRAVSYTQEVLIIRRGRLRADFYAEDQKYLESLILTAGDVILLAAGGHGFEVLEAVEMIEIKQGPYSGAADKTRFDPVPAESVVLHSRGKE